MGSARYQAGNPAPMWEAIPDAVPVVRHDSAIGCSPLKAADGRPSQRPPAVPARAAGGVAAGRGDGLGVGRAAGEGIGDDPAECRARGPNPGFGVGMGGGSSGTFRVTPDSP